jgi:hypothetical protein
MVNPHSSSTASLQNGCRLFGIGLFHITGYLYIPGICLFWQFALSSILKPVESRQVSENFLPARMLCKIIQAAKA